MRGIIRIIDNRWLYIAVHCGVRRSHIRQFPGIPRSYILRGLEISFPSWRNSNEIEGGN